MGIQRKRALFSQYGKGLLTRGVPRLEFPTDALISGNDVILADGGLKTRPGYEELAGDLPSGTVEWLGQVRFPTNDLSYLLAQVRYSGQGWLNLSDGPTARAGHSAIWDTGNGRMLVFGGYLPGTSSYTDELWAYDPDTDIWSEVTTSGTGPSARSSHIAVYDAANERMIVSHGGDAGGPVTDTFILDCTTDTWSELSTSGDTPSTAIRACFRTANTTLIAVSSPTVDVYELNLSTGVWTDIEGGGEGGSTWQAGQVSGFDVVYDTVNDVMFHVFGNYAEAPYYTAGAVYYFDANTWNTGDVYFYATNDYTGAEGSLYYHTCIYCSGYIVVVGGKGEDYGIFNEFYNYYVYVYDISEGTWTRTLIPTAIARERKYSSICVADTGVFYLYGGYDSNNDALDSTISMDTICGSGVSGCNLYATPDHLPASSLDWTGIYDLGTDCGTISVAVLGDRCIITDSKFANAPLVWMGCLSDDGSDWAYPKHVLTFKDGERAYDIGQYVLDQDEDVSADIGGMDMGGFIDIVTDVPKVEAFYLDMGTVNTGFGGTQAYSVEQEFSDTTYITRADLKGEIIYWVRDDTDTNLDASAAVDKGDGIFVGIPCTGHPFNDLDTVYISGSTNYNGAFVLHEDTDVNELVIEATYVAETFNGSEVVKLNRSQGHFEGATYNIDNAAAVNKGGGKVGIPMTGQPYSTGNIIEIRDSINYNDTYTVDATSSADEIVITETFAAESFSGSETVNQRITLGSGNDNANVEPGVEVILSGESKTIVSITDDGEADTEVHLSSVQADDSVDYIYAVNVIDEAITINYGYDVSQSEYQVDHDIQGIQSKGYSLRIILDGSDFGGDRYNPKFTFRHGHCTKVSHVSIGERDGATADTVATPTEITFNGGESGFDGEDEWWTDAVFGNIPYGDPPEYDYESDILDGFTLETAKQYIIVMDVEWTAVKILRQALYPSGQYGTYGYMDLGGYLAASTSGDGYYYKLPTAPFAGYETESWNQSTVNGYTWVGGTIGLIKIESQIKFDVYVSQAVVAYTTDVSHLFISFVDSIESVDVDQSTPGSSLLYHAVCFDNRQTFKVFKSAAWRSITRLNGSTWEYNNSATATPNWVAASTNSLIVCLYQALGVSYNQWTTTEIEAMDSDDWQDTDGFVPGVTAYLDWAVAMQADGDDVPSLTSYTINYLDTGSAIIEGYQSGDWTTGLGWTDNTEISSIPLAQDGSIEYDGSSPFEAGYHVLDYIPGFHYRLRTLGTSTGTSITKLLYKAPCQPLQNIGLGQPGYPLAFVWHNSSSGEIRDDTTLVIDETNTETFSSSTPLDENLYIYVGCLTQFNSVEMIMYSANDQTAALTVQYWTGIGWTNLTANDGTSASGKALGKRGFITWTLPSDWKKSVPLDASLDRGYYVRITSNATMHANTAIGECRVYPVPPDLVKHREAVTFRDRLALIGRPDFQDMIEISRQYEEYGFWGTDSGRYRVGGTDSIQCAVAAWNMLLLGKKETWQALTGSSPSDFAWTTIEASRHIPINSRVIIKAPVDPGDGLRHALFFLNQYGAFAMSGLQADDTFATGRVTELSRHVDWWNSSADEYLDIGQLASSGFGTYWPRFNWLVWSVPMVVSGSSQSTNNRLIIYDLTIGAWLPPVQITAASLCLAYHYDADVPGKLADVGLYAGDYSGNILRLFAGDATTDDGTNIAFNAKTGLITMGNPGVVKELAYIRVFGSTTGSGTVKIYRDSESSAFVTKTLANTVNPSGQDIDVDYYGANKKFRSLQFEFDATGVTEIDAIEIEYLDAYPMEGSGV